MTLFSRLLRPREVRNVLRALEDLKTMPLADTLCFEEIALNAREVVISNVDKIRDQTITGGQQPLEIALNIIINICGRDLSSGNDHVYRGMLTIRGKAKRALFEEAQINDDRAWLHQARRR